MIQHFARYDETRRVTSTGHMAFEHIEAEQKAGGRIVALDDSVTDIPRAWVVDGRIEYRDPPPRVESYAEQRERAYPPLCDLADALYWRERGDDKPWQAWLAACDAVKSRFPKEDHR